MPLCFVQPLQISFIHIGLFELWILSMLSLKDKSMENTQFVDAKMFGRLRKTCKNLDSLVDFIN